MTLYHSQTDGQMERIGTIMSILVRIAKRENNGDEQLPYVLWVYGEGDNSRDRVGEWGDTIQSAV